MRRILAILSLLALPPALAAQPQEPPAELAKLDRLLGNWKGKGEVHMAPGADPAPWTSASTVKRILGAHFLQEDMKIEFGAPSPMVMRSIYAWNARTKRYEYYSMTNMGYHEHSTLHFADEDTMVGSKTAKDPESGMLVTEQWVTNLGDGKMSVLGRRSVGGDKFLDYITGSYEKGGEGFSADDTASAAMSPPPEEMEKLSGHAGKWTYEGWIVPMPNVGKIEIEGRETVQLILGGHVLASVIEGGEQTGAAMAFRGMHFVYWDQVDQRYEGFGVENYGTHNEFHAVSSGDRSMTYYMSGRYMGVPQVARSVVTWNEAGTEAVMDTQTLYPTGEPAHSFHSKMKKAVETATK